MKEILDPLILTPGARLVALISPDGVPIALLEAKGTGRSGEQDGEAYDPGADFHAYAGLAANWLGEATRAIAPLSWPAPTRVVLRAARGTLIMHAGPGAVLLMLLDKGVRADGARLPMDSAVARMQRHLRTMGTGRDQPASPGASAGIRQAYGAPAPGATNTGPSATGIPAAPLPGGAPGPSQQDRTNHQGSTGGPQQSADNNLSEISGDQ